MAVSVRMGSSRGGRPRRAPTLVREREGGHVSEMQRRRLLLALVELTAEDGLDGTTVGRVCARAHVSRRTFYDLFADREACLLAALEHELGRIAELVVPVYGGEGAWSERIRLALGTLLEHFQREPAVARLCLIEATRGPRVADCRGRVLQALIGVLEQGARGSQRRGLPPQLTAESIVGGALAVIAARLSGGQGESLVELLNPLMGMIVLPYLGESASRRELAGPAAPPTAAGSPQARAERPRLDQFADLPIRITFRTARVLAVVAAEPGASNRRIGQAAGISDQGQISRLLSRLARSGLVVNSGAGRVRGEANAWTLSERGAAIHETIRLRDERG